MNEENNGRALKERESPASRRAKPAAAESQVIYCPLHTNSWLTSCRFARSVTFSEKYLTPRRVYAIHFISRAPLSHTLSCFIYFLLICDASRDTEQALLDCFHTSSSLTLSLYQSWFIYFANDGAFVSFFF